MNEEQYKHFLLDLFASLAMRYKADEANIIVEWFKHFRGSTEKELIGEERFEGLMALVAYHDGWDLYSVLMARAWIYAPFIFAEHKAKGC